MQIQWIENTCFLIKTSSSKRILLDPNSLCISEDIHNIKADIITLSNPFFNYDIKSSINIKVINSSNNYLFENTSILGIDSYCDNCNGLKRGENIIYRIETENITLCHLGHLGHLLDNKNINLLKNIDFLFIPIGGKYFLDGGLAWKLIMNLKPKFIIPMGFKKLSNPLLLEGPNKFLFNFKNILKINNYILNASEINYGNSPLVILMNEKNV